MHDENYMYSVFGRLIYIKTTAISSFWDDKKKKTSKSRFSGLLNARVIIRVLLNGEGGVG